MTMAKRADAKILSTLRPEEFDSLRSQLCLSNRFVFILALLFTANLCDVSDAQLFNLAMSAVPGGGVGPQRPFKVGKFEVTNQQFAAFLNNAQLDGGATERGANMVFQTNGMVTAADGAVMFRPFPASRIIYVAGGAIGSRYNSEAGFGTHPVIQVSWIGALKFCNWLTIDRSLGLDQRVYTEGPSASDWHPVVISTGDWAQRDLNDVERQALIDSYLGFRLPMDNLGLGLSGWVGAQENPLNEWYKMAAYDPLAPNAARTGPGGESVSPDHWLYGVGRETITGGGANFLASGDPFEFSGTSPTGYYNGSNGGTINTSNPYGVHDVSGNVAEWMQDHVVSPASRAIRGGSWNNTSAALAATYRDSWLADQTRNDIGFRVLQGVPLPPVPDGDVNGDGVVDLADFAESIECLRGPALPFDADGLQQATINVGPGFSFSPPNITIEMGDIVHWDWVGGTHNVTSGSGGIHDGNFYSGPANGSTSFFFDVEFDEEYLVSHPMTNNLYPFYCEPHFGFGMIGSVRVNRDPCFVFDTSRDDHVDLRDFAVFQNLFLLP